MQGGGEEGAMEGANRTLAVQTFYFLSEEIEAHRGPRPRLQPGDEVAPLLVTVLLLVPVGTSLA